MNTNVIDVIFILLITLFIIRCFLKGFVSELLSMSAIVFGFLASLFLYKNGGEYLREQFWPGLKLIPEIIAFLALFVIVFLLIKFLEILLKGIIERIHLSGADRFLGVLFGLAEGLTAVSLILFLLRVQPLFDSNAILSGSVFADFLLPFITGRESIASV